MIATFPNGDLRTRRESIGLWMPIALGITMIFTIVCFTASSSSAQTRPAGNAVPKPLTPAPLPPGWDQIDERLVFLTIRLSSAEASVEAVDKAIKATCYTKSRKLDDAEHARKGNELMDRKGGGPVPWQDFYGRTAQDFYFHPGTTVQAHSNSGSLRDSDYHEEHTDAPKAIDRPPQLDYIYRANTDNQKRAEAAAAELAGKIDQLLERRRQLESEQSALWCEIAFQVIAGRELASKPLYRFNLKNGPQTPDADDFVAAQAACDFIRTVNQLMADAEKGVENDPGQVLHEFSDSIGTARKQLNDRLAQQEGIALDLSDSQSKISKLVAAAKRLDDLAKNMDEACRLAKEGDLAGDEQRKNTFRGVLQSGLLDTAGTLLTADQCVLDVVKEWKLTPDVKKPATEPTAHLDIPATSAKSNANQPVTNGKIASEPQAIAPSIEGVWQEIPGAFVTISQENGTWTAQCSYKRAGYGEVRWEINDGTISVDGKLHGTLHHTKAPAGWTIVQIRDGNLSKDGQTITGTALVDGTSQPFTWTKTDRADNSNPRQNGGTDKSDSNLPPGNSNDPRHQNATNNPSVATNGLPQKHGASNSTPPAGTGVKVAGQIEWKLENLPKYERLKIVASWQRVRPKTTLAGQTVSGSLVLTRQDSPYLVTGPLVISSGATLTIEPGAVVLFSPQVKIENQGSITAISDGDWIVLANADPNANWYGIPPGALAASNAANAEPPLDWQGILSTGKVDLRRCLMTGAEYAVETNDGSVSATECVFAHNGETFSFGNGGHGKVQDSLFLHNGAGMWGHGNDGSINFTKCLLLYNKIGCTANFYGKCTGDSSTFYGNEVAVQGSDRGNFIHVSLSNILTTSGKPLASRGGKTIVSGNYWGDSVPNDRKHDTSGPLGTPSKDAFPDLPACEYLSLK